MKWSVTIALILSVIAIVAIPAPGANAGGNGWAIGGALLGGVLLDSVLSHHDHVIVGPVCSPCPPSVYYLPPASCPPSVYYPPPTVYQPQPIWIPDHYESRWQINCEIMYQRPHCYSAPITVFIPGHWEYR